MKLRQISENWLPKTPWDSHEQNKPDPRKQRLDAAADRSRSTIRYNNKLTPIVFASASDLPISRDHIFIVNDVDINTVRNTLFEYPVEIDDIEGFQSHYGVDLSKPLDPEEWDAQITPIDFKDLESAIGRLLQ